ncbi:hypothetical protein SAMD00019534_045330, partial [Acytostelium subglobosum LB1]|uniref:hypothetical protein n=1 Tax=Acytostelium subglobosum LB1 TaxID=1410327 RepID=UPI000644CADC
LEQYQQTINHRMTDSPNRLKPLSPVLSSSSGSSNAPSPIVALTPISASQQAHRSMPTKSMTQSPTTTSSSSTTSTTSTSSTTSGTRSPMSRGSMMIKNPINPASPSMSSSSSSIGTMAMPSPSFTSSNSNTASKKNIEYILLAEFDIDVGSKVKYQYPSPTGEDESLLAEFMLPDGSHKRDDDWTVFFLNRPDPDGHLSKSKAKPKPPPAEKTIWMVKELAEETAAGGPPPKKNDSAPELRNSVNVTNMNNSNNNISSGNNNNNSSSNSISTTSNNTDDSKNNNKQFLYCLNFMNNQKDDSVRRGAIVKSLAICTTHPFIHIYKPFMILGIQKYFSSPSLDVIVDLYNSLNGLDMSTIPYLNDVQKHILRSSPDKNKQNHSANIAYLGKQMPVYIPITFFPDEVGDYKVITLVQKFGNDIMKIFNGILSQKRILFLGYGCSAGEVCNYVLAACSMVCPPLKGIRERTFPYTNLVYLDFLSVPGYITGVTNPMFEEHPEWWDILCNIGTGKVVMNASLVSEVPDKFAQYDNDFMAEVNYNISTHYGEDKIKSLFQEYTQHIVDMALDEEEFLDDQTRALALEANQARIDSWTRTKTYTTYLQDRENSKKNSAIRDHTIQQSIKKLRKKKHVTEKEVLKIYDSFLNSIKTEQQVTEFLSYLPKSHGGLFPVAVGLFHQSKEVRNATTELLKRLDKIQTGSGFIAGLNPFLKQCYERNLKYLNS